MEIGNKEDIKKAIELVNSAFGNTFLLQARLGYGVKFYNSNVLDNVESFNILHYRIVNNMIRKEHKHKIKPETFLHSVEYLRSRYLFLKENYEKIFGGIAGNLKHYKLVSDLNGYIADADTEYKVLLEKLEELRGEVRVHRGNPQEEQLRELVKEANSKLDKLDKKVAPKKESYLTQKEYIEAQASASFLENVRKGNKN